MADEENDLAGIVEMSETDVAKRLKDFTDLLKDIESLDDKKRTLWKEIYANAIADRQNSYVIFTRLLTICKTDSTQFAIHGRTIASFVERMSKSNDQLVKLAELIARAQSKSDNIDPEDMFSRINSGR